MIATTSLPRVSFVIPVRNDASRLERCLSSINSSAYPRTQLEVLVIDNGSTDDSAAVANQLGADVISMPQGHVAALRNHGARLAAGDLLAFVDADNEIAPDWIGSAVETLSSPGVAATGALYTAPEDGTWVQRTYGFLRGRPRGKHDVEWLGSGNLVVWRSFFEAVRGFDTSLETCEDVDFCNRLRATGARIVSNERLKNVHHGDPATLRELFKGELWRGRDNLRVSLRGPVTWRALPGAVIPLFDAVMVVVMIMGAVFSATGRPHGSSLACCAGLAILLPPFLKSLRSALRSGGAPAKYLVAVFSVACVYDLARTFALVARAGHHRTTTE
jgi:GT2 family glycosyltransferase